jgi:hypothetical protein
MSLSVPCCQMYKRHKLLEYRCNRYFFIDTIDSFIPVPAVPKVSLPACLMPACLPDACLPA